MVKILRSMGIAVVAEESAGEDSFPASRLPVHNPAPEAPKELRGALGSFPVRGCTWCGRVGPHLVTCPENQEEEFAVDMEDHASMGADVPDAFENMPLSLQDPLNIWWSSYLAQLPQNDTEIRHDLSILQQRMGKPADALGQFAVELDVLDRHGITPTLRGAEGLDDPLVTPDAVRQALGYIALSTRARLSAERITALPSGPAGDALTHALELVRTYRESFLEAFRGMSLRGTTVQ